MKKFFLSVCLLSIFGSLMSQDINIDNQTNCPVNIDLSDDCSDIFRLGPFHCPDNTTSNDPLSMDAISTGTDVIRFQITEANTGDADIIEFSGSCSQGHTSGMALSNISCGGSTVYIDWSVSGGGDFDVVVHL